MKCPIETGQVEGVLLAYSSGELNTQETEEFEDHLRLCVSCREKASAQVAAWSALDLWEAPAVSADFDRQLHARIENEVSWWDRLMRPVLVRRGLPVAAAAAAIIAAVLVVQPSAPPSPAVPESAQVQAVSPDQAEHALQDMEALRDFSHLLHSEANQPQM
jgi:anti-sigma factor RsiW